MTRWARILLVAMLLAGAAGCATVNGGDPRDPLEGYNRAIYTFNDRFDEAVGKPVAGAYRDVVPAPIRTWIRNFFGNIADLWIGANNLLQGKPMDATVDWARFAFNSTIGIFGLNDVATEMGLEKHDEDFGQTFGRWGMASGAYLVWPFIGPSSVRDSLGLIPDWYFDPVLQHKPIRVRNFMSLLRATGRRADLLEASRILEEAALDKYVFQRDAYLQRRNSQVHDGNLPRALRESPRADALPESTPESIPEAVHVTAPLDSAVQMLEAPAATEAIRGG